MQLNSLQSNQMYKCIPNYLNLTLSISFFKKITPTSIVTNFFYKKIIIINQNHQKRM